MFQLIAGPCVIESEEMVMSIAAEMKAITRELGIPYTFKASFDKEGIEIPFNQLDVHVKND